MALSKNELRKVFLARRNAFSNKALADNLIFSSLLNSVKEYNNIFIYISYGSEVDTHKLIENLILSGKNVLVPKCDTEKCDMTPVRINSLKDLEKNDYGISEPVHNENFNGKIDVVICPGLVFDKNGNRIGYGKGYYDKFLASLDYCPLKIGVCYDFQIDDFIPADDNDVKMNMIISENRMVVI